MFRVVVTRGPFSTRKEAAAYAGAIVQHEASKVIGVRLEESRPPAAYSEPDDGPATAIPPRL
jgi:hypothetical protein